jgi:DNA-binding NarL/FixJ family response regulator
VDRILATNSGARIIALTSFDADDKLLPTARAGALGYLFKDADTEALVQTIRRVACGEP